MATVLTVSRLLATSSRGLAVAMRRNIGTSYIMMAKMDKNADPIQRLFAEKLQAYKQKSKPGKLFDASPDVEAEIAREKDQIRKRYGGGNLEEFPKFDFK